MKNKIIFLLFFIAMIFLFRGYHYADDFKKTESKIEGNTTLSKQIIEKHSSIPIPIPIPIPRIIEIEELLKSNDLDTRELAAVELAKIDSYESVKILLTEIKSASKGEKYNLLQLINLLSSSASLKPLIDELLGVDGMPDAELNRAIRKALRNRKNPELVQELIQALELADNQKEQTQLAVVIHGLKNDIQTPYLVSSAINPDNYKYIEYMFGGLSSISSQRSMEGIFKIVDNFPDDPYIQSESLKAVGFSNNDQKLQYVKNILLTDYKSETKQLALLVFKNDGTSQATNILTQVLDNVQDSDLKNNINEVINYLPPQPLR